MEEFASDPVVARELEHLRRRLVENYKGLVPASIVADLVREAVDELNRGSVRSFVPVLVERHVRRRLSRMLHPAA